MIYITQPIYDEASLSSKANMLLSWLPGARMWLNQAIADVALNYNFSSEGMLINSIMSGLYSSENLYLKHCDFSAAPDYLLSLSGEQLEVINEAVTTNSTESHQALNELCQQLDIVTGEQNTSLQQMLEGWADTDGYTSGNWNVSDSIALRALQQQLHSTDYNQVVIKAAAAFAQEQGIDARSFALLMAYALRVYHNLFSASKSKTITSCMKSSFQQVLQNLRPLVLQRLACPQLAPPKTTSDVTPLIKQWTSQQRLIGFTDFATGLKLVAENSNISQLLTTSDALGQIRLLDQQILACLQQAKLTQQNLTQDAKNWCYQFQYQQQQARFVLAEDGCLTLNHFSSSN